MPSIATQAKAVSANAVKNNSGTVVYGGNLAANSAITNAPGLTLACFHSVSNGSRIPHAATPKPVGTQKNIVGNLNGDGSGVPTAAAVSGGTYGVMTAQRYIIRRYTNFIAGLASTIFNSGCADTPARRSINRQLRGRTTTMYQLTIAGSDPGTYPGGSPQITYYYDNQNNVWANDVVATPTRALPGDVVYRIASTAYTVGKYTPKNT